jgi:hypothetical protein
VKIGASFGWLVKKEDEGHAGKIELETKESNPSLSAKLVLERINLRARRGVGGRIFTQRRAKFHGTRRGSLMR